jgi:hypothetical protein
MGKITIELQTRVETQLPFSNHTTTSVVQKKNVIVKKTTVHEDRIVHKGAVVHKSTKRIWVVHRQMKGERWRGVLQKNTGPKGAI